MNLDKLDLTFNFHIILDLKTNFFQCVNFERKVNFDIKNLFNKDAKFDL